MASTIVTTNIKVLHASPVAKDVILYMSKAPEGLSIKRFVLPTDTLLEEHLNAENQLIIMRFHYLSSPPPQICWESYIHLQTLQISCVFSENWFFSHLSAMPVLKTVYMGSGCFVDDLYSYRSEPGIKIEPALTVQDFTIRVDLERCMESEEYRVRNRIGHVLDCAAKCFSNLTSVSFHLPIHAEPYLKVFRTNLPQFLASGSENKDYAKNELFFKAHILSGEEINGNDVPSSTRRQKNGSRTRNASSNTAMAGDTSVPPKKPKVTPDVEVVDLADSEEDTDDREDSGGEGKVQSPTLSTNQIIDVRKIEPMSPSPELTPTSSPEPPQQPAIAAAVPVPVLAPAPAVVTPGGTVISVSMVHPQAQPTSSTITVSDPRLQRQQRAPIVIQPRPSSSSVLQRPRGSNPQDPARRHFNTQSNTDDNVKPPEQPKSNRLPPSQRPGVKAPPTRAGLPKVEQPSPSPSKRHAGGHSPSLLD